MKRSQTATEYLIILAVVIVIAIVVINTMGGFPGIGSSSSKKVSDLKLSSDTVGIESYNIGSNNSSFQLKNNYFNSIVVNEFRFNQQENLTCNSSNTNPRLPISLNVGETRVITCTVVNSSTYTLSNKQTPKVGLLYTDSIASNRLAGNVESYGAVSSVNSSDVFIGDNCDATGGHITIVDRYKIHTFSDVGIDTFTVNSNNCTVEVLVVAGGGAGGNAVGGGGGAGGVNSSTIVVSGEVNVVVGAKGLSNDCCGSDGFNGGDSAFGDIVTIGGGGGGGINYDGYGENGGSGGGSAVNRNSAGSGIENQGHDGGISTDTWGGGMYASGGGGGASESGEVGIFGVGGKGGDGVASSISGVVVYYGGGGGGGVSLDGQPGAGGLGGGGSGTGASATSNTGGGGGGARSSNGGDGGSGIVIVRYLLYGNNIPVCADEQTKCEDTTYYTCSNGNWVNNGNVSGQCGYVSPEDIGALRVGLIAYYPLDGNTSDESGNGNNGNSVGAIYNQSGKVGGMYSLDGIDDTIFTDNLTSDFDSDSVTISVWFKSNVDGVIISENELAQNNAGFHDSQVELFNGEVFIRVWGVDPVSLGTFSYGVWHHAILRYDDDTDTLDGFLDSDVAPSPTYGDRIRPTETDVSQYYSIGGQNDQNLGSGAFFKGGVDEVSIWNRALNSTEINVLYNNGNGLSLSLSGAKTPDCMLGDFYCDVTDYVTCSEGVWVNNGEVDEYCGYYVFQGTACSATGGNITEIDGYRIHTFKNIGTNNFTVNSGSCEVEVLVVAGGGGGGTDGGAGGGAGGLIYDRGYLVSNRSYNVVVGAGGNSGHTWDEVTHGENSIFDTLEAIGGGEGGWYGEEPTSGGSGGGGTVCYRTQSGASGVFGQGNSGAAYSSTGLSGGGGGAGYPATAPNGGAGLYFNQFISVAGSPAGWFAGGGGGLPTGIGGNGGGGNAQHNWDATFLDGISNTGGGGGGGNCGSYSDAIGGKGGSGIVIIRYALG